MHRWTRTKIGKWVGRTICGLCSICLLSLLPASFRGVKLRIRSRWVRRTEFTFFCLLNTFGIMDNNCNPIGSWPLFCCENTLWNLSFLKHWSWKKYCQTDVCYSKHIIEQTCLVLFFPLSTFCFRNTERYYVVTIKISERRISKLWPNHTFHLTRATQLL